ncbi:MAG: hypothetical protein KatS3mg024_2641 [Armatimonadota bacterium]|nr:MAG: hypothetical protein KatS3mg024_2641 [Armatimonadota bacterium]
MTLPARLMLGAAGGAAFGASQIMVDYGALVWLSFVLLGLAFGGASRRQAASSVLVWTLIGYGAGLWWVTVFGLLPWAILTLWQAAFLAPAGLVAGGLRGGGRPFAAAAGVAAMVALGEWLAGSGPAGIAMATASGPLARNLAAVQWASVFGAPGLSFLVAFCGLAAGLSLVSRRPGAFVTGLALPGILLVAGWALRETAPPARGHLKVAAAQGMTAPGFEKPLPPRETLQVYFELSARARMEHGAKLVLWPETACPGLPFQDEPLLEALKSAFRELGMAAIIGAQNSPQEPGSDPSPRNVALGISREGRVDGAYEKQRLVPFGEYVPSGRLSGLARLWRGDARDYRPGGRWPPMPLEGARIGVLICSETMFTHLAALRVREGATLLAVLSNDSWFGRGPATEQLARTCILRAVEFRRSLARSAESGYSLMIAPDGRIVAQSALMRRCVVAASLPIVDGLSIYSRLLPGLPLILTAVAVAAFAVCGARDNAGNR